MHLFGEKDVSLSGDVQGYISRGKVIRIKSTSWTTQLLKEKFANFWRVTEIFEIGLTTYKYVVELREDIGSKCYWWTENEWNNQLRLDN